MIFRDLRTFWKSLGRKVYFFAQIQHLLGKRCTNIWYILHILK